MTGSIITEVLLPLALAFIMFGMGLSLTRFDFLRLWQTPAPIVAGFVGQIIALPLLAFGICVAMDLSTPMAVGLMILAACPGGTTSNVVSHLAKANLALSVSLTAISSIVCVLTAPFVIQFSLSHFANSANGAPIDVSLSSISLGLLVITLLPIVFGMLARSYFRDWAIKVEVYFRRFALVFLLLMIIGVVIKEHAIIVEAFNEVFIACLLLNFGAMFIGVISAKLLALSHKDTLTLAIEIGLQNSTMAMLICISLLQAPSYAVVAGVYSLTMYAGAGLLIAYASYIRSDKHTAVQAQTRDSR
ncbi:bile acid:sodium symporter family protein [Shewanella livingstonensis]|uniref:Bile acid:sodium symporter family protein n=1 Tax=Shewanella livingstonensis TaxID=150120 RepID=A0A3G8LS95_9GAMM|nr:bile acid:sodium symporter family protein [Shewanella livingstonensis]AZG72297.1 bile acid:sodium symporter family protein [Shewanella livingstonensis]